MPATSGDHTDNTTTYKPVTSLVEQILSIHARLDEHEINHAFGGALALAYHTRHPRTTSDIDINIALGTPRARETFQSLPAQVRWGAKHLRIAEVQGEVKLRWMRQNSIDLFFATHEFHAVVHSRVELVPFAGNEIPILSATDLTVFKTKFGRDQDWVDIKEMLRAGTVDIAEALYWVEQLVGRTSKGYNDLIEASDRSPKLRPPRQRGFH